MTPTPTDRTPAGTRAEAETEGQGADAAAAAAAAAAGNQSPPPSLSLPLPLSLPLLSRVCSYFRVCDLASLLNTSRACVSLVAEQLLALGLRLELPSAHSSAHSYELEDVCAARLRRHIGQLKESAGQSAMSVTIDSLALLAERMAHLTACSIDITEKAAAAAAGAPGPGPSPNRIRLPPALRRFALTSCGVLTAAEASALLDAAAAQLDQLEDLSVNLKMTPAPDGCLSALPRMRNLRTLRLLWPAMSGDQMSDGQIADLRAAPSLEDVYLELMSGAMLRRLLRPPHALRWKQLRYLPERIDDDEAKAITSLGATLTAISLFDCSRLSRFDFLRQLPHLTELRLDTCGPNPAVVASLIDGLQSCVQLELLALRFMGLSSAQLSALLPHFPRLRKLTVLCGRDTPPLDTLSCFSGAALAKSLVRLDIGCQQPMQPPMAADELRHLLPLRRLRTLIVRKLFAAEALVDPTSPSVAPFTLPSLVLPSLTCVQLQCHYGYSDQLD